MSLCLSAPTLLPALGLITNHSLTFKDLHLAPQSAIPLLCMLCPPSCCQMLHALQRTDVLLRKHLMSKRCSPHFGLKEGVTPLVILCVTSLQYPCIWWHSYSEFVTSSQSLNKYLLYARPYVGCRRFFFNYAMLPAPRYSSSNERGRYILKLYCNIVLWIIERQKNSVV